ncbi:hypothetical protein [Alteribacter aurantiacus]|uniref:hypothetical protein n=1 Tax=Alteribacter aurantiacus TaxID=254410 RepID=UPI000479E4A5|nr:hypothetical protein [Alteribacter aurantiacus]
MKKFLWLAVVFGVMAGCENNSETSEASRKTPLTSPPNLTVTIGKETVRPLKGIRTWSVEKEDGTVVVIEVDSNPPWAISTEQEPVDVEAGASVSLAFNSEPISYQVREWDRDQENTLLSTHNELIVSNYDGETVLDVMARWDEGMVYYTMYLNVQ